MGRLFAFLRAFPTRPPLVSQPNTEPAVSTNRKRCLNSLPISQGSDGSLDSEEGYNLFDTPIHELKLRDEAKFLKACGTLPETPSEIRKASIMLNDSYPNGDLDSPKFHSWLPNTSTQKLNLEMKPDHASTPNKLCKDWVSGYGSSADGPNSCLKTGSMISTGADDSDAGKFGTSVHAYAGQTASVQSRNKSVRFKCPFDASVFSSKSSSCEAYSQSSEQCESPGDETASKVSPYPTPLKLTDDMQTPGTVFPSFIGNMVVGKNPRIRTQYIQSVVEQVEDFHDLRVWREQESYPHQQSGHLIKPFEQSDIATSYSEVRNADTATPYSGVRKADIASPNLELRKAEIATPHLEVRKADIATPNPEVRKADIATSHLEVKMVISSVEEEMKVETSLSSCMKPLPPNQCVSNQWVVTIANENNYFGKNPGDQPILGTVAASWNEDESSPISPKWWDGNGIPNSTTKYKEDQKVSWHATPFEERLEKALSEKHFISQRRNLKDTPLLDLN